MPIDGQDPSIRQFCDDLALESEGMTQTEAWNKGICLVCKEPALPKCYSDAGRSEYNISATCEQCFDEMFQEDDDSGMCDCAPGTYCDDCRPF